MPNGKIRLYNKLTNAQLVELDILNIFNIEDNLNDQPSNAKFKVITSNTYREEFEVNTVIYHADTETWWVIKSDESTYLQTGEYEHEISVVEYLEWYSYKHLPNCAFAPATYDLEQMLVRLFRIARLTNVQFVFPAFLDKDKIMPFMSFENFTVANAVKTIGRAINAIPKMYVDITSGYVPKLTFVNRSGLDTAIVDGLDTQFPTQYEKNMNSSDQFLTRSVSNITNAKSSNLVIAPLFGGFKTFTPNSLTYVNNDSKVFLPSKIDKVDFINVITRIIIFRTITGSSVGTTLFEGYYLDAEEIKDIIISKLSVFTILNLTDLQSLVMPDDQEIYKIAINDVLGTSYPNTFFRGLHTLKSKFDFDTSSALTAPYDTEAKVKDRTSYWNPLTNELILSKLLREGVVQNVAPLINFRDFELATKTSGGNTEKIQMIIDLDKTGIFNAKVPVDKMLIQVGYYPIADIKVSIDNDNDSQDEKYFNQQGKVIDALSTSRLITAHTNDSVEGTKIRNARYTALSSILPLGQIVRDSNQLYVISQRSIDATIKNGNEYYNVVYTLTNNRIGRSENIVADSAVINYKTPDDNLVFRTQLYKDYIELSLVSRNNDAPYLDMSKALVLGSSLAGTQFDYTVLAANNYGTAPRIYYVKNPTIFDLHKSKLMNVNWQDNNILGYRYDTTGSSFVQTPILYTDSLGKATAFELLFCNTQEIQDANADYNDPTPTDLLVPFSDLTQVPNTFFTSDVYGDGRFSIRIETQFYAKDPFEIPVFEYMLQANDDYDAKGNVIVGNDLFSTFTGDIRYHYVINNTTRFTAENADKLYTANPPSSATDRRVVITRSGTDDEILDLDILSTHPSTDNTSEFTHIGIYATDGTNVKFLFAINDYATPTSWKDITLQGKTLTWSSSLQTAGIDKVWYNPTTQILNVAELVGGVYVWVERTRVVSNAQPALTVAQEYWVAPIAQVVSSRFTDYANIRLFINNWKI